MPNRLLKLSLAFAVVFTAFDASAQVYPSRTIRIIVPFATSGGPDVLARVIGEKLLAAWGQPVVVENRTGAGANVGAEVAANAAPDGYTYLVAGNTPLTINPSIYAKVPFDPIKSFAPVSMLGRVPLVMVIHPSVPAGSIKELIALARAKPGELTFGSAGGGSPQHLSGETLKSMAGIDLVHVPYKGAAAAITDLLGGRLSMMLTPPNLILPHIKAGKLRALAVASLQRIATLPDIPTIAESAIPGFETDVWIALVAPAGTPPDIIAKMNAEIVRILQLADVREKLVPQGIEPGTSTPDELAALIKTDLVRWARIIREAKIKFN